MFNQKLIILMVLGVIASVNVIQCQKKVVCYYTNWAQYRRGDTKYFPENIEADLCTHIIYSFAKLSNNQLAEYEWNDHTMYQRVIDKKLENPSLKVMIAVGGWNFGSIKFSDMVSNPITRANFVSTSVAFLKQHNFDGLDLDWEYPASRGGASTDKALFTLLCQELKAAFLPDGLLLSAAVSAGKSTIDIAYDVAAISNHLDFINLMAYDLHGSWESKTGFNAPLYGTGQLNVKFAVQYWLDQGCDPAKLNLGLATYGRSFTLSNPGQHTAGSSASGAGNAGSKTGEPGFLSYYEICQMGGNDYFDNDAKVPYKVNGNQWVGYDNKASLELKLEHALLKNLGGIMFWALDLDDFTGDHCGQGKYPLIKAAKTALSVSTSATNPPYPNDFTNPPNPIVYTNPPTVPVYTNPPVPTNPSVPATNAPSVGIDVCHGLSIYPDEDTGCTHFFQCSNGQTWRMPCPTGLKFNKLCSCCDWPANVPFCN